MRTWIAFICVLLLASACSRSEAPAPAPAASPAPGAENAKPAGGRLFVTNEVSGDISVIDVAAQKVITTIPVGKRPRGIRVSPDGSTLYVALSGSPIAGPGVDESKLPPPDKRADGIGVVSVADHRLLRIVKAGSDPEQTAVSQDGMRLFVANEDVGEASVVAVDDGHVLASLKVGGEPEGVEMRPDGKFVYVTSEEEGHVAVIDAEALTVLKTLEVGPRPRSTAFLPDSSRAYVSSENGGTIAVIDSMKHTVLDTIKLTGGQLVRPMGVVASPDGKFVFVTTGRGKNVVILETATSKQIASIEVGERPWGIAVSPDGSTVFTANGPSNDVSIVDVASRTVKAKVTVGDRPWGIVFVP